MTLTDVMVSTVLLGIGSWIVIGLLRMSAQGIKADPIFLALFAFLGVTFTAFGGFGLLIALIESAKAN